MQTKRWKDAKKLAKNLEKVLTKYISCDIINSVKGRYKKNPGQKEVTSMARAIAECKCNKCGAKFEKIQFRSNRKEADSWKEWAEENCTVCPDCWEKAKKEEDVEKAAALIEELHLPEITGKSEKQIKYANDLRTRYILRSANYIRFIGDCLSDKHFSGRKQYEAEAQKKGLSVEEWIEERATQIPYGYEEHAAWTILHTGAAREIIDALVSY